MKSVEKQLGKLDLKPKKQSKIIKAQQFRDELAVYLDRYAVPEHITNKFINYLLKRYDSPDDLVYLRETLGYLE